MLHADVLKHGAQLPLPAFHEMEGGPEQSAEL